MISVIMPTYNKAEYLDFTIASFVNQSNKNFEIVIVNDGGNDESEKIIDKYIEKIHIQYFYQKNKGRSSARNKAMEESKGEVLLFNDDDRIVCPNFIEVYTRNSKRNTVSIGEKWRVLTIWKKGLIYLSDSNFLKINQYFPEKIRELEEKKSVKLLEAEEIEHNFDVLKKLTLRMESANFDDVIEQYSSFNYPWVLATTTNMSVSKELAQKIGGFDENYTGWGFEDTDFAYQLYKSGAEFQFCRSAKNYHQSHPSSLLLDTQNKTADEQVTLRNKEELPNREYFCKKHHSLEVYVLMKGLNEGKSLSEINTQYKILVELPSITRTEVFDLYAKFANDKLFYNSAI